MLSTSPFQGEVWSITHATEPDAIALPFQREAGGAGGSDVQ